MARLKVTIAEEEKYLTYGMTYCVWWPWLTSKCVTQACQHQLSFVFPGGPGLSTTGISPFWNLLKLRMMELVVTTPLNKFVVVSYWTVICW